MLLKIKKNYFIIIVTFLFLYFFFNLLDGERGLVSYFEKKKILTKLKHKKISLTEQIEDLEHNKSLLTTDISCICILTKSFYRYSHLDSHT